MNSLPAVPAGGRVVTVCCGDHRPAGDCVCCQECPDGAETAGLDPAIRAMLAHDDRERAAALRLTVRRAYQLVTAAAIEDHLRCFDALLRLAVDMTGLFDPDELAAAADALAGLDLPHFEGSLT